MINLTISIFGNKIFLEIIKEIRRRKSSTSIFEKLQQVNRFLTNKNEIEIENNITHNGCLKKNFRVYWK